MSSRPISTSQPAFAMVCGSITFFLFGVMGHTFGMGGRRRRARRKAGVRDHAAAIAWGVKRNTD